MAKHLDREQQKVTSRKIHQRTYKVYVVVEVAVEWETEKARETVPDFLARKFAAVV